MGMEMKISHVPFQWFHSHPIPAGSSENVNRSHPACPISSVLLDCDHSYTRTPYAWKPMAQYWRVGR